MISNAPSTHRKKAIAILLLSSLYLSGTTAALLDTNGPSSNGSDSKSLGKSSNNDTILNALKARHLSKAKAASPRVGSLRKLEEDWAGEGDDPIFKCAMEIEDVIQEYSELDEFYETLCTYYDSDDSPSDSGRFLKALDFLHPRSHDESPIDEDPTTGIVYTCEASDDQVEEHQSICEGQLGGKTFIENSAVNCGFISYNYINSPVCLISPECFDVDRLTEEMKELIEYDFEGEDDECGSLELTFSEPIQTYPCDGCGSHEHDDVHEHGDTFHIRSAFETHPFKEWCIQPEVSNSDDEFVFGQRAEIIIHQCDGTNEQEWTFDEYGRIQPAVEPYLCITRAAFNTLELDYCGSADDMDSLFIHNSFENTILWKKANAMVFTIANYSPEENDKVVLAQRDRSLHIQEWEIEF